MKKWFHERLVIIAGFRMWELAHFFIIAEYSVTFCNTMRSRLVLVYYFGEILKMLIWLKNDQLIVVSLLARGITLLSPYLPMVANARLVPYDFSNRLYMDQWMLECDVQESVMHS